MKSLWLRIKLAYVKRRYGWFSEQYYEVLSDMIRYAARTK